MPMEREEFEDAVAAALDEVPEAFAAALADVTVVVEAENPDDPDIYGLYLGAPLTAPDARVGAPPPRVAVYMRPLLLDFPERAALEREIRITVLHEVGHHMGLDEHDLARLGYA